MDREPYVLRMRPLRVVSLCVPLVIFAGLFLAFAAAAVAAALIIVDSVLIRGALFVVALFLVTLAVYFLLLLRVTVIRIEVGPERMKLRLPRSRGPLPLLSTIRAELPYEQITSVESRDEIYTTFGLVTVQRVYSLLARDGARFPLGVMTANWESVQLPVNDAAERIAARIGGAVVDRGALRVGGIFRTMIQDVPPWDAETISPAERAVWHRRAALTVQFSVLLAVAISLLHGCFKS